jgi:hypothetical protein
MKPTFGQVNPASIYRFDKSKLPFPHPALDLTLASDRDSTIVGRSFAALRMTHLPTPINSAAID